MRIGIDVREAAPAGPGQQRYLWRLGTWLGAGGHDVHFLTVREQAGSVPAPPGTTLHRLHGHPLGALRATVADLELDALMLNPERAARYHTVRADVLRAGYGTDQYEQKLRSFRSPGPRAIRSAARHMPPIAWRRRIERGFYESHRPPPLVVAQSALMRDAITRRYDVARDDVRIVRNGVDPSEFTPAARRELREAARARWRVPDGALCFVCLAHNFRLKGVPEAIAALSRWSAGPAVRMLVVGRGTGEPQRRWTRRLAHRAGVAEKVVFTGPLATSVDALAAADALLHLSWHDSFGFAVLEAMATGLPVVTTRWVGAAELIDDGVSGFLVDPADRPALLAVLTRLADPALREAVGATAAEVASEHGEERNFRSMEAVFEESSRRREGR